VETQVSMHPNEDEVGTESNRSHSVASSNVLFGSVIDQIPPVDDGYESHHHVNSPRQIDQVHFETKFVGIEIVSLEWKMVQVHHFCCVDY
jgi:hypothetical protein